MKKLLISICVVILAIPAAGQDNSENINHPFNLTHSIGAGFKEHEFTFYLTLSRSVSKDFSAGIKGGVYNYSENTVNKIIDTFIAPTYASLNVGHYTIHIDNMTVRGTTYIGSLTAGYKSFRNILLSAGIGVQIYKESDYSLNIFFDKSSYNQTVPKQSDVYYNDLKPYDTRKVIKPYFSLSADYLLGILNLGIYADNIYSAGLNIGVSF